MWGESEWNELFEDLFLIEQSENYNHFLGSIVLAKENASNMYSIIDAQQRFKTISILILSIINQLYKINEEKVANSYKNTFLKCNNDGDECYKIERMVVSENTGSIIFVKEFEEYIKETGYSIYLCRGYDLETKGKVENAVKYIKEKFLINKTHIYFRKNVLFGGKNI